MKTISLLVLALVTSMASAAVIENFDTYNVGDTFGGGVIAADPEDAGNKVLFLDSYQSMSIAIPGGAQAGVASMDVYDMGLYIDSSGGYGPRWGVGGTVQDCAVTIIEKAFLGCEIGYGMGKPETEARTASWFSPRFFGGPRLADSVAFEGAEADGAWATWTFTSSGGDCYIDNGVVTGSQGAAVGLVSEIWAWGGKTAGLSGVYIDNVAFEVPEPATMSLLALGGLALIRRR